MSKSYLLVVLEYLIFSLHFKEVTKLLITVSENSKKQTSEENPSSSGLNYSVNQCCSASVKAILESEYLCQYKVASSCNGNNLQITCLDNEKIAIQRVFFGARPTDSKLDCKAEGETDPNCCRRGYGDCLSYNSNTAAIVTRLCTGRPTCLYLTRSVKLDRCPDPTLDTSDYMTVFYNCIPDFNSSEGETSKYCATIYSRSGVNQMWILKISKELLDNLKSQDFTKISSLKTYDFSTLYTTIPHDKLKSSLFDISDSCFFNKNGTRKFTYLVIDSSSVNICSDDKIQAKPPLYLSNKEYPLPRTGISNCTCMIVKHPSQARLSLRAIEISFIDPQCSVSLTVKLGEGPENKFPCSYKMVAYRQWLEVTSDKATVSLTNEQDQGDTYLWMQIESPDKSEDPVRLYCGDALEKFLNPDATITEESMTSTNAPSITSMESTKQETTMESTKQETTIKPTQHATTMESTATVRETSKMTSTVQTTTEEDMIIRSGMSTSTLNSQTTKRTTSKPITTHSTTLKPMATKSTTVESMTTKSTTMKPMTTKTTTMKSMTTQTTTTKEEKIDNILSTTNLTTNRTSSSTLRIPSTTITTTKFVPHLSATTHINPKSPTSTVSLDRSSKGLVISHQKKDCFGTCHDTFGKGFTLNLKSFINPSKVKEYCRKIDDRLSCFESQLEQCSSTEKMDADKELKANLAGQEVICEENLNEVQYMKDCYNMKEVRRGLTSCDQLLHPFENIDKTDVCNLEKEFVECVAKAVDDCNDTTVSMFMYNVTNELFDFLYNTEDCDTESDKSVKEPEVMVTEKPTPEPETDDGADKTTQQPVVPEKKAGDDKRNAASRVQGFLNTFHIVLIAYLMVFLS